MAWSDQGCEYASAIKLYFLKSEKKMSGKYRCIRLCGLDRCRQVLEKDIRGGKKVNKKKMMQGMLGCRLRAMDRVGNTTTVKEEETAYTNQDQIILAKEKSRNGTIAQTVWHNKEVDGKKYRRLFDATNQEWLTDWILCE